MRQNTEGDYEKHDRGGRAVMGHGGRREHQGGYFDCGCHYEGGMHQGSHFGSFGHRRFMSTEEVIAHLEEYLKQLKAEATGVEEHIAELKKKHS